MSSRHFLGVASGLFVAAVMTWGSAGALGDSIGLNLGGQITPIPPDQVAGLVPQAYWNNTPANSGPTSVLPAGTVRDDANNVVAGMSIDWNAGFTQTNSAWGFTGPNLLLMQNGFNTGPNTGHISTFTFNNIPYAYYDVIAYFNSPANPGDGLASIAVAGGAAGSVDPNSTKYYHTNWFGGNFNESAATDPNDAAGDKGNYIRFYMNTADSFELIHDQFEVGPSDVDNWRSSITGIQIVKVIPEPASIALLGVGGLALLRRRR